MNLIVDIHRKYSKGIRTPKIMYKTKTEILSTRGKTPFKKYMKILNTTLLIVVNNSNIKPKRFFLFTECTKRFSFENK